jgi:hypothetical protein
MAIYKGTLSTSFLKLPVAGYYWHQNYKIFDIGLTARLWSQGTNKESYWPKEHQPKAKRTTS